jgi:CDP-6-deoxy-D-xylo-4-hexulose-3-dehydrase
MSTNGDVVQLRKRDEHAEVRARIAALVAQYFALPGAPFVPGKTVVPYAGAVFDEREIVPMVDAILRGWFGLSSKGHLFERTFPERLGKTHGVVVNSGSSANLLAISALTSSRNARPLRRGDEIVTCALGFPTTVNPIVQNGLVPVFVDAEAGTYNIDVRRVEEAVSPRTRAIAFAHTLGNPANVEAIGALAKAHELFVIEDCCDAVGSRFDGRPVGSFGTLATASFYPAHHMTMGEGGFVATDSDTLAVVLRAMRDWGRDCHCIGQATMLQHGSCGTRFACWLGDEIGPVDHKYVYSEVGYNLKPLELQCAMGLAQIERLDGFCARRRANFDTLYRFFAEYEDYFELPVWLGRAEPSWFAFPLTVKDDAPFTRAEIVAYLEDRHVRTRGIFAGNLLRHPAYGAIERRVVGELSVADRVLERSFLLGVYPGITEEMMSYVLDACRAFLRGRDAGRRP